MSVPKIDDSYIDLLQKHSWKGNVRELKNSIERSLILIEGDTLDANALPYEFCMQEGTSNSLSAMALAEIERKHIQKVLAFTKGNKAEAARLLEIGVEIGRASCREGRAVAVVTAEDEIQTVKKS